MNETPKRGVVLSAEDEDRRFADRARGLFEKFYVHRTDYRDLKEGDKHYGCEYFVLDMNHDPHARAALEAYANSCQQEYPRLAKDLRDALQTRSFGIR